MGNAKESAEKCYFVVLLHLVESYVGPSHESEIDKNTSYYDDVDVLCAVAALQLLLKRLSVICCTLKKICRGSSSSAQLGSLARFAPIASVDRVYNIQKVSEKKTYDVNCILKYDGTIIYAMVVNFFFSFFCSRARFEQYFF